MTQRLPLAERSERLQLPAGKVPLPQRDMIRIAEVDPHDTRIRRNSRLKPEDAICAGDHREVQVGESGVFEVIQPLLHLRCHCFAWSSESGCLRVRLTLPISFMLSAIWKEGEAATLRALTYCAERSRILAIRAQLHAHFAKSLAEPTGNQKPFENGAHRICIRRNPASTRSETYYRCRGVDLAIEFRYATTFDETDARLGSRHWR